MRCIVVIAVVVIGLADRDDLAIESQRGNKAVLNVVVVVVVVICCRRDGKSVRLCRSCEETFKAEVRCHVE